MKSQNIQPLAFNPPGAELPILSTSEVLASKRKKAVGRNNDGFPGYMTRYFVEKKLSCDVEGSYRELGG